MCGRFPRTEGPGKRPLRAQLTRKEKAKRQADKALTSFVGVAKEVSERKR